MRPQARRSCPRPARGERSTGASTLAERRETAAQAGRIRPAGVHRVDGDIRSGEVPRPLLGERDLRTLRSCVRLDAVVVGLARLQRVDVESLEVHAAGGDDDHPPRRRRLEQRQQHADRQELRENLCCEGELVALVGDGVLVRQRACVQDEHVEAVVRLGDALCERSGRCERREIGGLGLARADCDSRALGLLRVAADDADVRTLVREHRRGDFAQPGRRAGDDRERAVETQRRERLPIEEPLARVVADSSEAADDARLERRVQRPSDVRVHRLSAVRIPAAALSPVRLNISCSSGSKRRAAPFSSRSAS